MAGIETLGGYVPRLRLAREAIADAHVWSDPGLAARGRGERSMCNWDEDAVTMAVEAARDCLGSEPPPVDAVFLASTTLPYADRQHSALLATALGLGEGLGSLDVTSSQRAGTSALLQGFAAVNSGMYRRALVVATDKRRARAASPGEFAFGDGAAAVAISADGNAAQLLAAHTATVDFVDHFRAAGEAFDYTWEERWIRDEGIGGIVPPAVRAALDKAGLDAGDIDHFVMSSTIGRAVAGVARSLGIAADRVRDDLGAVLGECGCAHPLVMLAHTLENEAKAGDVICLVGFGQGCDVLLLRLGAGLDAACPGGGISGALANRQSETNYQKYLAFNDLVQLEKGMRAEPLDFKTALTVTYRKRDMLTALTGGRCRRCGTPQFPASDICVNPQCRAQGEQEPYSFRDRTAEVLTWSADYLTYIPSPPSHYGMITFPEGGRFMTDFTDVNVGELSVGMDVRMVFRIKSIDTRRGFVRYFWKATPVRDAG